MDNKDMELFKEALRKWGIEAQRAMCVEECAELINALAKERRGRSTREDILTELADVSIMVDQMALHYGLDDFKNERNKKIMRLNEKVYLK
jgi:NTP pyrophosphatase (non-canonical NTP hydrolase)